VAERGGIVVRECAPGDFEGAGEIAGVMFVMFGEFFERPHTEGITCGCEFLEPFESTAGFAQLAVEGGQVPQRAEQELVVESSVDRAGEQSARLIEIAGLAQPAAEAQQFGRVLERGGGGVLEGLRHDTRQARQAENVECVVVENGQQAGSRAGPEEFEIKIRDERTRHIAVALKYDPGVSLAPIVLAMGQRKIAERIKRLAMESGVPVIEDKPLAAQLAANCNRLVREQFGMPRLVRDAKSILAFLERP